MYRGTMAWRRGRMPHGYRHSHTGARVCGTQGKDRGRPWPQICNNYILYLLQTYMAAHAVRQEAKAVGKGFLFLRGEKYTTPL